MLYHKDGFPEENEAVMCTVTSVQYNSVFCTLDEYGKSGMIHISEVAPGRIRNIRDYVIEGKKVVCKVLRTDLERGHIDLSLRRVSEGQRRNLNMLLKQEQQAEIERARKEAITQSRGVLGGKFTEQVMPYLPDFKYDPTEARFIGSPIDFIVFPGLATGDPKEIVIVEIKSGKNPHLTASETKIRQLIENGMVRWELIQRPAEKEG